MSKVNVHLEIYKPYLTTEQSDQIRDFCWPMNPQINFVMGNWPWLEVRKISEKDAERLLVMLQEMGIRFRPLAGATKRTKSRVQVAVETYGE